jgi:hypothetical protein
MLPVAHVEAGLCTFHETMPEEASRRITNLPYDRCGDRPVAVETGLYPGSDPADHSAKDEFARRG